jgi:hypothetical protein
MAPSIHWEALLLALLVGCAGEAATGAPTPTHASAGAPALPSAPSSAEAVAPAESRSAATGGASARAPSAEPRVAPPAIVDVHHALVVGSVVVSIAVNRLDVVGHAMDGGRELWRTPFQEAASNGDRLELLGSGNLLVRSGRALTVVEPGSGKIVHQHRHAMADRKHLWERNGMCSLRGECSVQLIDCDSAKPLGKPILGEIQRRTEHRSRRHHAGCWSFDVNLIGRSGDALLFFGHRLRGVRGASLFAVSARSGARLWQSSAASCRGCTEAEYGMDPQGRLCWGYADESLQAFSCRGGATRWRRKLPELDHALWVPGGAGGLFVSWGGRVALLDASHGRERWSRPVAAGTVALPSPVRLPRQPAITLSLSRRLTLQLLDAASGRPTKRLDWSPGDALFNGVDDEVRVRSAASASVAGATQPAGPLPGMLRVKRFRDPSSGRGAPNRATLTRRDDGSVVDELPFDAWLLGESMVGNERVAAVMMAGKPWQVRLYRLAPSPRRPAGR